MTYSLNTLNADRAAQGPSGLARFAQEIGLVLGAAALLFALLALLTHSPSDAAWSTSGTSAAMHNWGGQAGAWLSDGAYFLFGFSCWWLVFAGPGLAVDAGALASGPAGSSARAG